MWDRSKQKYWISTRTNQVLDMDYNVIVSCPLLMKYDPMFLKKVCFANSDQDVKCIVTYYSIYTLKSICDMYNADWHIGQANENYECRIYLKDQERIDYIILEQGKSIEESICKSVLSLSDYINKILKGESSGKESI